MKKILLVLIVIAILNVPVYSQDAGVLDSIVIECDSLIIGRSMPITFRVVNDFPLSALSTGFILIYENGASAVFDSIKYVNRLVDPSVMGLRYCDFNENVIRFTLQKMGVNPLPIGDAAVVEYFFTAFSPGNLTIDSAAQPPTYDFALIEDKPWPYYKYPPQFQQKEIRVVEGTPTPVLGFENDQFTTIAGDQISTGITFSSPVGYPISLSIKDFTKYDNSTTTTNTPIITENEGYVFEWSPTISDVGIWSAVIEGCDSSGACVDGNILIQVIESNDYLIDFMTTSIPNFHHPDGMLWEDLDNDLYPEIITVGYNLPISTTFATYDFDYNNYTLDPGFIASGLVHFRPTISIGFIDSDNILDAIHPKNGTDNNAISVLPGMGGFEFDNENLYVTSTTETVTRNAVLNDFNKDAYLDYAVSAGNSVLIFRGLGTGYFQEYFKIELSEKIRSINSADFNLNGTNDLAIGTDAGVYIYQNLGNGTFQSIEFYPQSYGTVDIDITNKGSDFNGDRYYDFVITTPSVGGEYSEIVLYEGNPNGTFDIKPVRTLKGQVFGNCIGDFNNDNNLDIAFVNGAHKYIGILYGEGDGNFVNEQRFYISDLPLFSINCVDFDLDGDLDISSVGTESFTNGTLFLLVNQDNPTPLMTKSFELDILNNANMQLTSPGGKMMNNVSSSFTSSSSYLKNIDNNQQIDNMYSLKTIEDGVYQIELSPKVDLQVGDYFTAQFSVDKEQYRLAKNIPMSASGYKFLIYPSGVSSVNPIPGQFSGAKQPLFTWNVGTEVNFQLASDIDFTQLIVDSIVSNNHLSLSSELSVTDTTAYYWRVKPTSQNDYDGIYVYNLVLKVATDIDDDNNGLPVGFSLSQNYPNPFNPTTQLSFSLPEKSHVRMEIFNIVGQKIRTLTDREYQAGEHIVEWDGNDKSENKAASGIYLMKFSSDNFSKSIKMVMMK